MNTFILVVVIALSALALFFAKRVAALVALSFVQYFFKPLARKVGLFWSILFFDPSRELSNIIVALFAHLAGLPFGFLLLGTTLVVHLYYKDVIGVGGAKDYLLRGALIVFFVGVFGDGGLGSLALAIMASKFLYAAIDVLVFRSSPVSIGKMKEIISIWFYVAILRIF